MVSFLQQINMHNGLHYNKAQDIIAQHGLNIYEDIWHYSFNHKILKEDFYQINYNDKPIIINKPLNDHCPTLIYGSIRGADITISNTLKHKYNKHNRSQRKLFWYLKLTTLDDFLNRRTKSSNKPRKHFPTTFTYNKLIKQFSIDLLVEEYKSINFCADFDRMKPPDHFSGNEIVQKLLEGIPNLPMSWLKTVKLFCNDELNAIAIIVDDGKSISLENITAVRSKYSYGIILCIELIKKYSSANYYSFDAGISNLYGVYKDKIFIDSYEVSQKPLSRFTQLKRKLVRILKSK